MKNTIENKARFFALYWGQFIGVSYERALGKHVLNSNTIDITDYLELKPLSQITDEYAIQAADVLGIRDDATQSVRMSWVRANFLNGGENSFMRAYKFVNAIDFLRGNGYALGWTTPEGATITVKEQIEFGWIKIKVK